MLSLKKIKIYNDKSILFFLNVVLFQLETMKSVFKFMKCVFLYVQYFF